LTTVEVDGIREMWDWPLVHAGVTAGISIGGSTVSVRYFPEPLLTSLVVEANFGGVLGTF
jgi:formyltetrahydrofolate synthetase